MQLENLKKILMFSLLLIVSVAFSILMYYLLILPNKIPIELFSIILPIGNFFIMFFAFSYIYRNSITSFFKNFAEKFLETSISKNLQTEKFDEQKNIDDFANDIINSVSRLKKSNESIENEINEFKSKVNKFVDDVDLYKLHIEMDLKNNITECKHILKISHDLNESAFEKENEVKNSKVNILNIIDVINDKIKLKNKMLESYNNLTVISKDIDKIYMKIYQFSENITKQEDKVLSKMNDILTNLERQSINILNAYIFSNPENKSIINEENENSDIEREENLQNIKKMNEYIKDETIQIKNVFVVIFEANKSFREELENNKSNFAELKSAILKIPVSISVFFDVYNQIKLSLKNDIVSLDKIFDKFFVDAEMLKSLNIKITTMNKSFEDEQVETKKLLFEK